MSLVKHQPQAPRQSSEVKRVWRDRVGIFVCSAGFKGCIAARSPADISHPATRQWVGDDWSKLPPVGSPAVPKSPGERKRGAKQSSRQCSAALPKASPRPEPHCEPAAVADARGGGGTSAKQRPLPCFHTSRVKMSPQGQDLCLSAAPGGYIDTYFYFFPAFLRFVCFSLFLRFWCLPQ